MARSLYWGKHGTRLDVHELRRILNDIDHLATDSSLVVHNASRIVGEVVIDGDDYTGKPAKRYELVDLKSYGFEELVFSLRDITE